MFIGSCAGNFYALNKSTGEVQWSYDIRRDGKQVSFHGDPLVTNELILIGTDRSCDPEGVGHVYAFERESGKVRWKYGSTSVPTDIVQIGSNVFFGSMNPPCEIEESPRVIVKSLCTKSAVVQRWNLSAALNWLWYDADCRELI